LSAASLRATASLSAGMPATGVYLVRPSAIARQAASFTCAGVSKSGSPAPNPTTSFPARRSAFALASMARVCDGSTASTERAKPRLAIAGHPSRS